jgi:predicted nucleic acid-binding Zn ribbon protein
VADLATVLVFVASDLDARGYVYAGALRQAARRLRELEAVMNARTSGRCERCGAPLKQRPTGRPRKWCSKACRRKVPEMSKSNRNSLLTRSRP